MRLPILYSFRRCPYAMRARMALVLSGVQCEIREILLKDKPQEMLNVSRKGTVPVLITSDKMVLDESFDIMKWAWESKIPEGFDHHKSFQKELDKLVSINDFEFKESLDNYKYNNDENLVEKARDECMEFLWGLEESLKKNNFLLSDLPSLADLAVFPFVRQFSKVDLCWFEEQEFLNLKSWLSYWMDHDAFKNVMKKYHLWSEDSEPIYLI